MTTPLLDQIASPADLKSRPVGELRQIADELRADMIAQVSKTGGHLGASLGAIELTVALHAVFDAPNDHLIWDVGHQSYAHKMLTGRRAAMAGLRQGGGISGFPKRSESPYDAFGAGHSSTSISAALGFLLAEQQAGGNHAVAVIGDGALSGGMAFEAINHAGHLQLPLIIVLNDNDLSIAPPVGALARTLRDPQAAQHYFNGLGCTYWGPDDGHDIGRMMEQFHKAKRHHGSPLLIHLKTIKGKGFAPAETAPDGGHATGPFTWPLPEAPARKTPPPNTPSYTDVFAAQLLREAETDPRIAAITAAMPSGTGLTQFLEQFPERGFDVGIAEQHAVTMAAGMAANGMRPFCAIYSTFLQRAYDQIIHDVALQNLPVRFAIDRAGLVGADGATHAGSFDIAALCALPNMTVMAAANEQELARMVHTAARHDAGPIAFRFPRGHGPGAHMDSTPAPLTIGKGRLIQRGQGIAILSFGARLDAAMEACDLVAAHGICPTLADARFAKPLDIGLITNLATTHHTIITLEEGSSGGFGAQVAHYLCQTGLLDEGLKLRMLTLPDQFIDQDTQAKMHAQAQLDGPSIAKQIMALANP